VLGVARAAMASRGVRGPVGSFLFLNLPLLNDQSLESVTGVGAPPWTWPASEQVIDILHKTVYAHATGAVADRLVQKGRHGGTDLRRGPFQRSLATRACDVSVVPPAGGSA